MEQKYCYGCMKPKTQTPVCEHCGFDERRQNEQHQLPMGTLLQNQYIVGRVLGQGGFGITYIGWDRNLAIPVAIKEFFPSGTVHRQSTINLAVTCYTGSASEAFANHRDRFLKEARTLAKLSGVPEIVQVRNFFLANNTAYIIMEYVQGITLKDYLKKLGRRMTVQEVLTVMRPVLKALHNVHEHHLIHRDISPDNIMLPSTGGVKLIDFGTVRATDNSLRTQSTESIMKPGFAPIEQYQTRGNLGTWTDVYALSATFHYCLTGKIPEDALERLESGGALTHLHGLPGITPQFLAVMEKGLAVRIADRIQTVEEMYRLLYGEPIQGPSGYTQWNSSQIPNIPHVNTNQNNPGKPAPDPRPTYSGKQIFAPFRGLVSENILTYCEENAQKPILVETYIQQCVLKNRIAKETADRMLDHYQRNKPAAGVVYQPEKKPQYVDDGTIFGRFRSVVPAAVVDYCESVSNKPIMVETYLNQCVNRERITAAQAKLMLEHYNNTPHEVLDLSPKKKSRISQDGSVFGGFQGDIPAAVQAYCESVAHQPVLVETYIQQNVNRKMISAEIAGEMLDYYRKYQTSNKSTPKTPVQQPAQVPSQNPSFQSAHSSHSVYCTTCGKQIPENSKFCCYCGGGMKPVTESYPRWYCSSCKSQIAVGSKYCRTCGKQVLTPVIQHSSAAQPSADTRCRKCGTLLASKNKFCHVCGTPVQQSQPSQYPQGHCQSCGKKLTGNAKFCVYCGKPVNQ